MKKLITILICLLPNMVIANETIYSDELTELDAKTQKALKRDGSVSIKPNGQLILDTKGGYLNTTLTRIGENGQLETYCTDSARNAQRFLNGESLTVIKGDIK